MPVMPKDFIDTMISLGCPGVSIKSDKPGWQGVVHVNVDYTKHHYPHTNNGADILIQTMEEHSEGWWVSLNRGQALLLARTLIEAAAELDEHYAKNP